MNDSLKACLPLASYCFLSFENVDVAVTIFVCPLFSVCWSIEEPAQASASIRPPAGRVVVPLLAAAVTSSPLNPLPLLYWSWVAIIRLLHYLCGATPWLRGSHPRSQLEIQREGKVHWFGMTFKLLKVGLGIIWFLFFHGIGLVLMNCSSGGNVHNKYLRT